MQTYVVNIFSELPHKQVGGTCYANAAATALRATEMRIVGRKPMAHQDIVNEIVSKWGTAGAVTYDVLKEQCSKRQLRCERISYDRCCEALKKGRVVVASFYLDGTQWLRFSEFFRDYPKEVITAKQLGDPVHKHDDKNAGRHAVVICGQTDEYWKVKNSWGEDFGDDGYFRIAKTAIDFRFIDVFFRVKDLSSQDIENYKNQN